MPRPTGKINLIGLVLIAAVIAFIYSLIFFSKPILDNFDVKEAISGAYNSGSKLDDLGIKKYIEEHTSEVGEHEVDDGFGHVRMAPGLGLKDEDITVERDEVNQTIFIRVDYTRRVVLQPTAKIHELHFHPQMAGPIVKRL